MAGNAGMLNGTKTKVEVILFKTKIKIDIFLLKLSL